MVSFQETLQCQRVDEVDEAEVEVREGQEQNVGKWERIAGGVLGGLLLVPMIKRPTFKSLLLGALGGGLIYRSSTGFCPMYNKLNINRVYEGPARPHDYYERGIHVEMAYIVDRPAEELYGFWRNFENLPRFMKHVEAVRTIGQTRSHWVVAGPAGRSLEWDAEIINEVPNQLIAWRSLEHADVSNAGSVRFIPMARRGTEVRVSIEYIPPAGKLGSTIAWLFGREPHQQIQEDLRRFKRLMETGEIATTEGQPTGSCAKR